MATAWLYLNKSAYHTTHFCSILRQGQGISYSWLCTSSPQCLPHQCFLTTMSNSPLDSSPWHLTRQCAYCFCSSRAWSPGQHSVLHTSFYLWSTLGIFYLNSPNYPNPEPHHRSERTRGPELATLLALSLQGSQQLRISNSPLRSSIKKGNNTCKYFHPLCSQLICVYEIPPTRKTSG